MAEYCNIICETIVQSNLYQGDFQQFPELSSCYNLMDQYCKFLSVDKTQLFILQSTFRVQITSAEQLQIICFVKQLDVHLNTDLSHFQGKAKFAREINGKNVVFD